MYVRIKLVIYMKIDGVNIIKALSKYKNDKIIILGHSVPDVDSIVSGYLIEKVFQKAGYNACFCIPDKEITKETEDICKKYNFDVHDFQKEIQGDKFILVDHNEREVNGEIIAIIDHHPTSKENSVDLYFNKNISSTSTYICMDNESLFDKKDVQLAILALMLDTASFHSTKGREVDKNWAIKLCGLLNIDYNELYESGIYLTPLDNVSKVSLNGLKKYNFCDKLIQSSYIQINNDESNKYIIKEIVDCLKKYVKKENLYLFVFIVHNMIEFKTTIYKITENGVIEKKYDRYTSRGSDIMPSVEKEISLNYK